MKTIYISFFIIISSMQTFFSSASFDNDSSHPCLIFDIRKLDSDNNKTKKNFHELISEERAAFRNYSNKEEIEYYINLSLKTTPKNEKQYKILKALLNAVLNGYNRTVDLDVALKKYNNCCDVEIFLNNVFQNNDPEVRKN